MLKKHSRYRKQHSLDDVSDTKHLVLEGQSRNGSKHFADLLHDDDLFWQFRTDSFFWKLNNFVVCFNLYIYQCKSIAGFTVCFSRFTIRFMIRDKNCSHFIVDWFDRFKRNQLIKRFSCKSEISIESLHIAFIPCCLFFCSLQLQV